MFIERFEREGIVCVLAKHRRGRTPCKAHAAKATIFLSAFMINWSDEKLRPWLEKALRDQNLVILE